LYIGVIFMSKGIFVRLSEKTHRYLGKEAKKRGVSVYSLVKGILEEYAEGRLKLITPEEEALLQTRLELTPIKNRISRLESYINEYLEPYMKETKETIKKIQNETLAYKQIIDHVIVLEQKLKSLEIRIRNLEKEHKLKRNTLK